VGNTGSKQVGGASQGAKSKQKRIDYYPLTITRNERQKKNDLHQEIQHQHIKRAVGGGTKNRSAKKKKENGKLNNEREEKYAGILEEVPGRENPHGSQTNYE